MDYDYSWSNHFPGDSSAEAYRRELRSLAPVGWEVIESGQGDLLHLLIGRVTAITGARVLMGLSVLFSNHLKAEQVSHSMLATIISDLHPRRAHTVLETFAAAWRTAERRPFDQRSQVIVDELRRVYRRLAIVDLQPGEQESIQFLLELLEDTAA